MVLLCQKGIEKKFWLVSLFVNFCVFGNISKVKFQRAGLENGDFATFAIILCRCGIPASSQLLSFVDLAGLGVFLSLQMSHRLTFYSSAEQYCSWALLLSHNKRGRQPAGLGHKVIY